MTHSKSSVIILSLAAALACSQEQTSLLPDLPSSQAKMVNTRAADNDGRTILVKYAEPLQSFPEISGVQSFEKVFTAVPGKEAMESRYGLDRWYELTLAEEADPERLALSLAGTENVSAVQFAVRYKKASDCLSYPYTPSALTKVSDATFNDPSLPDQWNYFNQGSAAVATSAYKGADINVKDVWASLTTGDKSIIVAVVDEGVKYSHPDLKANIWTNSKESEDGKDDDGNGYVDDLHGYNFVTNGPVTWDAEKDSGHGTHCAGTIAAVNNNGIGVSGVAGGSGNGDGVRIMSCQIFDNDGGGASKQVANAIKYAADNGASVISCSFGYPGGAFKSDGSYISANGVEADAIAYFEGTKNNDVLDGGVAIFASGNDGDPYATYPGALNDVISVSAFGPDYLPTYYTNYGPGCNIVAPGGEAYLLPWTSFKPMILSTLPSELNGGEDYGYMQGTSMACPHVSGIAALGLSYAKKLGKKFTTKEFKNMIVTSANDFDSRMASVQTKTYASAPKSPGSLSLGKFYKQMGAGSIDAWLLMMKIEGVPCLMAKTGEKQWLDLSGYFGTSSTNLTYLGEDLGDGAVKVDMSASDKAALGIEEEPYIKYGRLYIHPTKVGSVKLTINAVGGGTAVGGQDAIGGMHISQTVSVIARPAKSKNGGWL